MSPPTSPPLSQFPVLRSDTLSGIFSGQVTPENSGCFAYARNFNPTTLALARQLAAMEGTEAAYATASGMSAIVVALLSVCNAGDTIIAADAIYGGTYALLADFLPAKCGIKTVWVDAADSAAVGAALEANPGAKAVYCETLSNPTLVVPDLPALATLAHAAGATFIVDNTFAPLAVTPARWGADIVIHSMTKGISGASDVLAGAVCGTSAFIASLMDMRLGPIMVTGPTLDAKTAAELGLRLPHLGLRVREQGRRALAFATALQAAGASVRYPGLASHPHADRWARLVNPGYGSGGVLTLDAGSRAAAERLMERLQNKAGFGLMAVSLGYHETLLSVSGASTSSEMPEEKRAAVGLSDGLLRISCGYTGSLETRRAQLAGAWAAHVSGEAARAAGKTPPFRAAAIVRDGRGGLTRLASWDSFGEGEEEEEEEEEGEAGGAGGGGDGKKAVRVGAGKEVVYVRAAAAAAVQAVANGGVAP